LVYICVVVCVGRSRGNILRGVVRDIAIFSKNNAKKPNGSKDNSYFS